MWQSNAHVRALAGSGVQRVIYAQWPHRGLGICSSTAPDLHMPQNSSELRKCTPSSLLPFPSRIPLAGPKVHTQFPHHPAPSSFSAAWVLLPFHTLKTSDPWPSSCQVCDIFKPVDHSHSRETLPAPVLLLESVEQSCELWLGAQALWLDTLGRLLSFSEPGDNNRIFLWGTKQISQIK